VRVAGDGAGGAGEGGEGEAIQGEAAEPVVREADPVRGSPGQCREAAAIQGDSDIPFVLIRHYYWWVKEHEMSCRGLIHYGAINTPLIHYWCAKTWVAVI